MGLRPARLGVVEFGRALVLSGDLDPIYLILDRGGLDRGTLDRWSLAYWCFYHAGVASRVAESPDFWAAMSLADRTPWPRGAERRHFRGRASSTSIAYLRRRYPDPTGAIEAVSRPDFASVSAAVRAWPGFGPWIAFKVADMLDRVLGNRVDFSGCSLAFYAEPAAGAALVAAAHGLPEGVDAACDWLLGELFRLRAPPRGDRPLGLQEAETIFCKWKSHMRGSYEVGKDTREIAHHLDGWGPLAARLSTLLPAGR